MGFIRTFLAITVLIGHSYGNVFTGPELAVEVFYVISGFLISFVLTESRSYNKASSFYLNRFLRLFPIYWVVALGSLMSLVTAQVVFDYNPPPFNVFQEIDLRGKLALLSSNLFIFGQDWIMFTGVREGTFQFVSDYKNSEIAVWQGLLVPPAWTLGVELTFYLLAPFVLIRPRLMVVLLLGSLLLRLVLIFAGPGLNDPWTYRFFPTELALFLAGALSHQFWRPWLRARGILTKNSAILVTGSVFLYCLLFLEMPYRQFNWVLLIIVITTALPFFFHFQRQFRWDSWVGELSYPIYITHWSILAPVSFMWDRWLGYKGYIGIDETLVVLALTVAISILLNRQVADRVEVLRKKVRAPQTDAMHNSPEKAQI